MKQLSGFVVLFIYSLQAVFAQLPKTDLYLIKLQKNGDSLFPAKATSISPQAGYNNQPSFSLDESCIYYSSAGTNTATEIWRYTLRKKKNQQLTFTALSEYSPREIKPGLLSAVTVEADSSQRIHYIDAASGTHIWVLEPDSVGYYSFLNEDSLVFYKLTDPHSLRLYRISNQTETWLGNQPARGFIAINRHALLYALKDSVRNELLLYDFGLHKASTITFCPPESEDYFWHPELGLLRSEKSQVLQWNIITSRWRILFDFSSHGIKDITRFALDKNLNYLVLVNKIGS